MKELKTRQICLFFLAFLPVTKFFTLPSILSSCAREDMWISAVISLLIDFSVILVLTLFMKNETRDIFTILKDAFGEVGEKIILGFYFVFFILKSILPITEQKDYIEYTLYISMPSVLYFLPFFLCAFYVATKRLRVIGRASDILWAVTLSGFILLMALSLSNVDYEAILPIGASGTKNVLTGTFKSLSWFSDGIYFAFFIGNFERKNGDGKKILLSFLGYALTVLIFMLVFNGVFTYVGFRQKFALTETAKYATVINNLGRFDYIAITLLLFSSVFSMSVPLFFASYVLKEITSIKNNWLCPLIACVIPLFAVLFLSEYSYSIESFLTGGACVYFLFFGSVLPLFLPLLTVKKRGKTKQKLRGESL